MIGGSVLFASIGGLLAKSDIEGFAPRFGTSILYTGIHLGAAWFFMKSMQFFNSKVRDAYSLIAAGVIALGLGQLVQPLLSLAGLDSSPYLPIIIIAITLPAIVPLYLGGRRLALILEIKN